MESKNEVKYKTMYLVYRLKINVVLVLTIVFSLATICLARIEYTITPVALTGQQAPAQDTNFTSFSSPVLNSEGNIVFGAEYEGGSSSIFWDGVYFWSGISLNAVVDHSTHVPSHPSNGYFNDCYNPRISDTGSVAFGESWGGVYLWDGTQLVIIADKWNTDIPGYPESKFSSLTCKGINDSDVVVLKGQGGNITGVYTGDGGPLSKIADTYTAVPGQSGASFRWEYGMWGNVAINSSSDVVFRAGYTGGAGNEGLYFYSGAMLKKVADGNTIPPNQTVAMNIFDYPSLNNLGLIAFWALQNSITPFYEGNYCWDSGQLDIAADSNTSSFGKPRLNDAGTVVFREITTGPEYIIRLDSGQQETIVTTGNAVPGRSNTTFYYPIGDPSINKYGQLAFVSRWYCNEAGGYFGWGIYTDVGGSLVKVVDMLDILIDGLYATGSDLFSEFDPGGGNPFNDAGQVAFKATLSDGRQGIFIANPVFVPDDGDFDNSGLVDFFDFAILASRWQATNCELHNGYCCGVDHEPDGDVDLDDLADMCLHWLDGTAP